MSGTSYQNNFRLGILKARHEFNSKTPQGVMSLIDTDVDCREGTENQNK